MSQKHFPTTLYATPDEWGETVIADWDTMQQIIAELRTIGDDWQDCSIDECEEWELIVPSSSYALYKRQHTRHDEWKVFLPSQILPDRISGSYETAILPGFLSRPAQYFEEGEWEDDFTFPDG